MGGKPVESKNQDQKINPANQLRKSSRLRRPQPKLRPILGQLSRFVGLLAVAFGWIQLCLLGSGEFFGEKAVYDELLLGGHSAGSYEVDMGFGGDYLGWGDINLDRSRSRALDFTEVADLVEELVKVWHAALGVWPYSWNDTFGSSSMSLESLLIEKTDNQQLHLEHESFLLGSDFDPTLFLNLGQWLAAETSKPGSPSRPIEVLSAATPEELLKKKKKRKKAKQGGRAGGDETRVDDVDIVTDNSGGANDSQWSWWDLLLRLPNILTPEEAKLLPPLEKSRGSGTSLPSTPVERAHQNDHRKLLRPWTWFRRGIGEEPREWGTRPAERRAEGNAQDRKEEWSGARERGEQAHTPGDGGSDEASKAMVLEALRESLVQQWPTIESDAAATGFKLDDAQLSRYLEVTFWNLEHPSKPGVTVARMVQETVAWRQKERLGELDLSRLLAGAESRQVYVNGFDRFGHAVVIYTPTSDGACSIEDSVSFLVYNLERALYLGEQGVSPAKNKVAQYTFIVDLARTGAVPPLKTVKASFEVMGRHYPMRPAKVLLINGGSMIQWIWRVLEPLVDQRTREKVRIVSSAEEEQVLRELFDPSQLERRFQGGCNDFEFSPGDYLRADPRQPQGVALTRTPRGDKADGTMVEREKSRSPRDQEQELRGSWRHKNNKAGNDEETGRKRRGAADKERRDRRGDTSTDSTQEGPRSGGDKDKKRNGRKSRDDNQSGAHSSGSSTSSA